MNILPLTSIFLALMASEVKCNLRFEICIIDYPGMHVHIASNGFLVASEAVAATKWTMEVTSGLRIEISDYMLPCRSWLYSSILGTYPEEDLLA